MNLALAESISHRYAKVGYFSGYYAQVGRPNRKSDEERLQALLRRIRLEAGLTQTQVSHRLGLPQSFVSKYESGTRRLDLLDLRRVCRALGISLAEFVRRWEQASR